MSSHNNRLTRLERKAGAGRDAQVIVKVVRLIKDGRITPESVQERWPSLAPELFDKAGIGPADKDVAVRIVTWDDD